MPRRLMRTMLVVMGCLAGFAWPVAAEGTAQPGRVEYAPTMLVLDASGSMAGADPAGGTKMDAAKRATRTLVDAAPDGAPIGLAVYGTNTGSSPGEKEAGCRDVTVLRGPDPIDKAALTGAVDGLRPRGYTPIGASLRVAADALPDSGPRAIVLVSDGIDTCAPPDPCEVAKQLSASGVELVVHAVGFGVDESARQQLTCIAQATGGTYTDAPDAKSLDRVLPRVTNSALRNYQPTGIPVTGTLEPGAAPELRPGQYLDVIERSRHRHYAVDVPEGMTAYFTAAMIYTPNHAGLDLSAFGARAYAPDGKECMADRDTTSFPGDGEVITATLVVGRMTGSCTAPGRYVFGVDRADDTQQPGQLPLEILVGLEPEVSGDKGPPETRTPVSFRDPGGAERPVVGGGSFATAATLDASGRYTDRLHYGEYVFYRVHLDWGQGLAYRVRYAETPGNRIVPVQISLRSPFRTPIGRDFNAYSGRALKLPTGSEALATPPIRYRNRENLGGGRNTSVAGWHYLAVKLGREGAPADGTVPVTIDLFVTGQPEPGPEYRFSSDEARKSGVFGQGDPRLATAGPPAGPGRPEPTAQGEQRTSAPVTALIVAGGLLLVAVIIGIVLAIRRRRGAQRAGSQV